MPDNRKMGLKLFGRFKTTINPFKLKDIRFAIKRRCYSDIFKALTPYYTTILEIARENVSSLEPRWILEWARYFGDKEDIRDIVIKKNDPWLAFRWAIDFEPNTKDKMINIVLNGKDAQAALYWAYKIGNREAMKNVVLESADPESAYWWAVEIGDHDEMKSIVINAGNPRYILQWIKAFSCSDYSEMRAAMLKADNQEFAYEWMYYLHTYERRHYKDNIGSYVDIEMAAIVFSYSDWSIITDNNDKSFMLKAIEESKNPEWAYRWAIKCGDHHIMQRIIAEARNMEFVYKWATHFNFNKNYMKMVLLSTTNQADDAIWAYRWALSFGGSEELKNIVRMSGDKKIIDLWNKHIYEGYRI